MANNSKRPARANAEQLQWFEVQKYQQTTQFTVADWSQHLYVRYMLCRRPKDFFDTACNSKEVLQTVLNTPLSARGLCGSDLGETPPGVWDLSVIEIDQAAEYLRMNELADVRGALAMFAAQFERGTETEHSQLLSAGFSNLCRERLPKRECGFDLVGVDLHVPDEILVENFKAWLKGKRAATYKDFPRRCATTGDLETWSRYRVLAAIDIELFCLSIGVSITNALLGDLLFSDESDVDRPERIRKVVRPLMKKLTDIDFILHLDIQAGNTEQKGR